MQPGCIARGLLRGYFPVSKLFLLLQIIRLLVGCDEKEDFL